MPARILFRATALLVAAIVVFCSASAVADEPAEVARRFYQSAGAGDLASARRLIAGPPSLIERISGMHDRRCVSLLFLSIDDVSVDGDHAEVRMTAAMPYQEPGGGYERINVEHPILGMHRAGDQWRIDRWTFVEAQLVDQIVAAPDDASASALVLAHPELFDDELLRILRQRSTAAVNVQQLDKARRAVSAFRTFAEMTNDDRVEANAAAAASMLEYRSEKPDYAAAVRLAEKALAAARRSGDPDTIGMALNNAARADEFADGNLNRAVPLLEEQFGLRERYADESIAQRAALKLSVHYRQRGEYRRCFPYITAAREIATRTNDLFGLMGVEVSLAELLEAENDLELALYHVEHARDLAARLHFAGYAGLQGRVAHCALVLGNDQKFRAAVDDLAHRDMFDQGAVANLWIDIAADHLQRHELGEADHATDEAMHVKDVAEDEIRANVREMLARVRLAQKRYGEAIAAAQESIAIRTQTGSVSQLTPWVLAARAHLGAGDRLAAYASLREALRYGEIERAGAGGSERQVALLFEPAAEAYAMLVDLLVEDGHPREALLVAEKAKARTLLDILDGVRSTAEADVPASMLTEERKREKQLVDENTSGSAAAIAKARLELETYRTIVDANRPRLRASRGAGELSSIASLTPLVSAKRGADVSSARGRADETSAPLTLVEYVAGEKRLHIFIITRGPSVMVRSVPIGRARLAQISGRFAGALATHDLSYAADARRLYTLLLAPVLRAIPRARDLAIVPDGALWRLPFESLIDADGRFAIETRTFFYAPSAAVLLREQSRREDESKDAGQFLGFGDPRIDAPSGELAATERGVSSAPMPEAAAEVKEIARIVGARGSEVYTGAEALESRAKSESPRYRIVHLATHGVLDDANPMYSRLLLARRQGDGEDGVLEAREMLDLGLRADLVVLSACDTARGRVRSGEGLIGMSWALFAAGAPTVIASQWQVGSARTEKLMTGFYERWMKAPRTPLAKARALRAARLAMLRDPNYRHPYYWSPFVLIGSAD